MEFSEQSRIWVYQANRELKAGEITRIQHILNAFTTEWTAHNHLLLSKAEIRYNRFLILVVDESRTGASGCSIDKSVNIMKAIDQEFHLDLFNRFNVAYRQDGEVVSASREEFAQAIKDGNITSQTLVFNNLVNTYQQLNTKWEIPYQDSWHAKVFGSLVTA